jgi:hypothetical protein
MARMHVPAVALGFLLFIAAGLAGLFFLLLGTGDGRASVGAGWALIVLCAVGLAMAAVGVLRGQNESQAEQP